MCEERGRGGGCGRGICSHCLHAVPPEEDRTARGRSDDEVVVVVEGEEGRLAGGVRNERHKHKQRVHPRQ